MSSQLRKGNEFSIEFQLDRLCSREKWVNPYEVLMLSLEATEEQIRSKYRKLSLYVHPDRTNDPRALQAFPVLDSAYRTLLNQEKRATFQQILREAKERVEFERRLENRRREMLGIMRLPEDTFHDEVQEMANKIFREIEERKYHFDRFD